MNRILATLLLLPLLAGCPSSPTDDDDGADLIAPTVLGRAPAPGATGVATGVIVTATFSEAMNGATIDATTFTLTTGGAPIAGTVTYGTAATFTPAAPLRPGTTHTATVTTGAEDLAGNALAANDSWTFTTGTAMTLTSTALTEGGTFTDQYNCDGANVSPPLSWSGGHPDAQSWAIVFTDLSNNLVHWVIWDIPLSTTSLPENVDKLYSPSVPAGAKQPLSYDGATRGYLGPCPPVLHTYQFKIYAIDVATLPGLGMTTTRAQAEAAIQMHDLGAGATLTADSL